MRKVPFFSFLKSRVVCVCACVLAHAHVYTYVLTCVRKSLEARLNPGIIVYFLHFVFIF